jgi:hypothetical protein
MSHPSTLTPKCSNWLTENGSASTIHYSEEAKRRNEIMPPWTAWLWDKIAGNAIWAVMLLVLTAVYRWSKPWFLSKWERFRGWFRKRRGLPVAQWKPQQPLKFDNVSVWLLIFAIILLALWNKRIESMAEYAAPRQMTKQQISEFGEYLKSHSQPHEVKIKYFLGDREDSDYAGDWAEAMRSGNWFPNLIPVDPTAVTCKPWPSPINSLPFFCSSDARQFVNRMEGIAIEQVGPNPPQPQTIEEKLHPTGYVYTPICEAAIAAKIQVQCGYSLSDDPPDTVIIFVGLPSHSRKQP